jgi:hypothetical protein
MGIKEEVVVVTKEFDEVTLQIRLPPPANRLICKLKDSCLNYLGKFKPADTLQDVYNYVKTEAGLSYDFKFRVPPSTVFSSADFHLSLQDASK